MAGEMLENLKALEKLTKVNLGKQFGNLNDFCASSLNFANRCDIHLALKDLVLAEIAAKRLREDSERRFVDGLITKDEYVEISDRSLSLVFDELSAEITNAIVKSCECARGEVRL